MSGCASENCRTRRCGRFPVGTVRRVLCASPQYLKQHRVPKDPHDIAGHTIISASPVSPSIEWRFGAGKKGVTVKVLPRLTVTNNDAAIQAALQDSELHG